MTVAGIPPPDGQIIFSEKQKSISICQARFAKIFCFSELADCPRNLSVLSRHEGRFANVSNAGQDAVDAGGFLDEGSCLRTAKPWGPGTPTLVSSLRDAISAGEGGLQARYTKATTEELLTPLRRKCRVLPVNLW
jgi:hypothetical protein